MDWRCSGRDNLVVERLRRAIQNEGGLHACEPVSHAKAGIDRYIEFSNAGRPHLTLHKETLVEF
jgi:putative transposase